MQQVVVWYGFWNRYCVLVSVISNTTKLHPIPFTSITRSPKQHVHMQRSYDLLQRRRSAEVVGRVSRNFMALRPTTWQPFISGYRTVDVGSKHSIPYSCCIVPI